MDNINAILHDLEQFELKYQQLKKDNQQLIEMLGALGQENKALKEKQSSAKSTIADIISRLRSVEECE